MTTLCKTCRGSKTQHLLGGAEGCECFTCLYRTEGERCRSYEPGAEKKPKPKPVDRVKVTTGADHPATSFEAAERAKLRVGSHRKEVFDLIRLAGAHGRTDDEIEAESGRRHQSVSARRRGLAEDGLVVDSGKRRFTRGGSRATVWVTPEHVTKEETDA